ncbi:MAG: N-acetyltransferase [Bacteroidaceae bacterium]|nr:N-acetyltransferase [Bacteroidaceae bacterium]
MNHDIRPATLNDLTCMLGLCKAARGIMKQSGNPNQWTDGYPSADTLRHDIELQQAYLLTTPTGTAVGMFVLMDGPDPTYSRIYNGQWLDDTTPYKVIHRIASTPESHGVFADIIAYALSQTPNLRIDTHRDNRIMQQLILRHGFIYCGIIHLLNGDERLAYQQLR